MRVIKNYIFLYSKWEILFIFKSFTKNMQKYNRIVIIIKRKNFIKKFICLN